MASVFTQNVVLLSLIIMIVGAADVCNICSCFPYEDDNLVISCKNYKNHVLDIDFEGIEWPKNEENYRFKAFFNNFPINLLPKYV